MPTLPRHKIRSAAGKGIAVAASRILPLQRTARNGHRGCVLWFTGLPAAGKSSIALELEVALFNRGCQVVVLDGDQMRHDLCRDLDFSAASRHENIRRAGEVAKLFSEAGFICLAAFISPYRADRRLARALAGDRFIEVYVNAPLPVCEARDPKGLYARARARKLKHFTGISAPYQTPVNPEIELRTDLLTLPAAVQKCLRYLQRAKFIRAR